MSTRKLSEDAYQRIQRFMSELLRQDELKPTVSNAQHNTELERLIQGRREEQFFFLVDLQKVEITLAVGWEEMGYSDTAFTFRDYLKIIPSKAVSELVFILGKQIFLLAARLRVVRFLTPKYIANIPLRHRDGRLLLCKRTISPWQVSEKGLILAYLSEFTIIKEYENEPLSPRFLGTDDAAKDAFKRLVTLNFFRSAELSFAPREMQIIRLYVENPEVHLSAGEIGQTLNMKTGTVQDYNKRIIRKARQHFGDDLPVQTARDVAFYLQKNGLLG